MWKQSAIWGFLIAFLLALGAWGFSDIEHRPMWPAMGMLAGFAMVIGFLFAELQRMKRTAGIIALGFATVVVFSLLGGSFLAEFYGCAAGMLLPVVLTLLIYQIREKRIITWDDIKSM